MIGIGFELGSVNNSFFGLRPELLTFEGRVAFWQDLRGLATSSPAEAVVLHRMFGESSNEDWMDYDTRRQIESCNDSKYTDYAKHMIRAVRRRFSSDSYRSLLRFTPSVQYGISDLRRRG